MDLPLARSTMVDFDWSWRGDIARMKPLLEVVHNSQVMIDTMLAIYPVAVKLQTRGVGGEVEYYSGPDPYNTGRYSPTLPPRYSLGAVECCEQSKVGGSQSATSNWVDGILQRCKFAAVGLRSCPWLNSKPQTK
jgi:hypothetical protein